MSSHARVQHRQPPMTRTDSGVILLTTVFLMFSFLLLALAMGRFSEEGIGVSGSRVKSINGFYATEAGLNRKLANIRDSFYGFVIPQGTAPLGDEPCGKNGLVSNGSGDFACEVTTLGNYRASTYIVPEVGSPKGVRVPPGDRFEGLYAFQYGYDIQSTAYSSNTSEVVARHHMLVRNRSIPLFQFAGFSAGDLEIFNGPEMTIAGPLHANGDLYLDTNTKLNLDGPITSSGKIYRGLKFSATPCLGGAVTGTSAFGIKIPLPECTTRTAVTPAQLDPYKGNIKSGIEPPELPSAAMIKAEKGNTAWDQADLRLVVDVDKDGLPLKPERPVAVVDKDGNNEEARSDYLFLCSGRVSRHLPDRYKLTKWEPPPPGIVPVYGPPGTFDPPPPPPSGSSKGARNYHPSASTMLASNPGLVPGGGDALRINATWHPTAPFAVSQWSSNPISWDGGPVRGPSISNSNTHGGSPIACDFTRDSNQRVVPDPKYSTMTLTGYGGIQYPHPCRFIDSHRAYEDPSWPSGAVGFEHGWDNGPNWGYYFFLTPGEVYGGSWGESLGRASGPIDRRGNSYHSLEVDLSALLTCIDNSIKDGANLLEGDIGLSDNRKNGLVFFFTVRGPDSSSALSNYGVVLGHGRTLQPDAATVNSRLKGLTVVTDQRLFLFGHYNSPVAVSDQIPAALFADTIQIHSENSCTFWGGSECSDYSKSGPFHWLSYGKLKYFGSIFDEQRKAKRTSVRAALLTGLDTSGGIDGAGGQDKVDMSKGGAAWKGSGLMNFVSFVENWQGVEFEYIGSMVSLWQPQHYSTTFQEPKEPWYRWGSKMEGVYEAPTRNWSIDPNFAKPEGLPPLTPLINFVQQEVFE